MFKHLKSFDKYWFNFRCSAILDTPPLHCDSNSPVLIVSQLHHPDVVMYLLAAKSFIQYVKPRGFVIVDDGLSAADQQLLRDHLGNVSYIPSQTVQRGRCPAKGCWERICALSNENQHSYVIQLDADTLTLQQPSEVIECIQQNRSFTLGTNSGREIVSFETASTFAASMTSQHVQALAEQAFIRYPGHEQLKYVRGCAGFAGFAPQSLPLSKIEAFSVQMEQLLGKEKWHSWGSEQVTSNYMLANTPNAMILPVESYPFWEPDLNIDAAVLVHFFGVYRFQQGMYQRRARALIHRLHSAQRR